MGRVREALFSIWGEAVDGARVLDLFAGSGVIALEAASRGADEVVAVEASPTAVRALHRTLERLAAQGEVRVVRGELPEALALLAAAERPFDLVFADPPYAWRHYETLLAAIRPLLADNGELALEHSTRVETPVEGGGLIRSVRRRYGETSLSLYRHPPA